MVYAAWSLIPQWSPRTGVVGQRWKSLDVYPSRSTFLWNSNFAVFGNGIFSESKLPLFVKLLQLLQLKFNS